MTGNPLVRLLGFLDQPQFPWKNIIAGFSIAHYVFETYLAGRQYFKYYEKKPPAALQTAVSQEDFDKSQKYGLAKAKFGFIKNFYSEAQNLAFIYFDMLPLLWKMAGYILIRHAPNSFRGEKSQSAVFFVLFSLLSAALSLPISVYSTFVIEERFGFNKTTWKTFIGDQLKSQALLVALGVPVLAGFLKIIQTFGESFFWYLWVFGLCVQIFMITVYPIFILPLFNTLTPLKDGSLKNGVHDLARRLSFPLSKLYVIDGSKRSAHSNAYFYGLPWAKHIVIYDTLIEKSEDDEVVAVLAHELGHWGLSHTTKLFAISQAHLLYIFALFSGFVYNKSLYQSFGFKATHPIIIGFILFGDALQPFDTLIKLWMNALSRKFEFEADSFAANLGYSKLLAKSLIKLQVQNLSTMDADWLFAMYHYTHPILPERLRALDVADKKKL